VEHVKAASNQTYYSSESETESAVRKSESLIQWVSFVLQMQPCTNYYLSVSMWSVLH